MKTSPFFCGERMGLSIIIGIAGGSGSGKTTCSQLLRQKLRDDSLILFQDRYYIDQSKHFDRDGGLINFDHPSAIDFTLMSEQLKMLKKGLSIEAPRYDFATHTRREKKIIFCPNILLSWMASLFFPKKLSENTLILGFISKSQKNNALNAGSQGM